MVLITVSSRRGATAGVRCGTPCCCRSGKAPSLRAHDFRGAGLDAPHDNADTLVLWGSRVRDGRDVPADLRWIGIVRLERHPRQHVLPGHEPIRAGTAMVSRPCRTGGVDVGASAGRERLHPGNASCSLSRLDRTRHVCPLPGRGTGRPAPTPAPAKAPALRLESGRFASSSIHRSATAGGRGCRGCGWGRGQTPSWPRPPPSAAPSRGAARSRSGSAAGTRPRWWTRSTGSGPTA